MFPAAHHRLPAHRVRSPRLVGQPRYRTVTATCGAAVLATVTAGCGVLSPGIDSERIADINVSSTMLQEGQPLPELYTCAGEGTSPPLQWSGLPEDDRIESLAILVDEPEEATVFWMLYGIDPQVAELRQGSVPRSARQGQNTAGEASYDPPCPESGGQQEYRFTVYALSTDPDMADDEPLDNSLEEIAAHTVARGSLTTTSG
ncbi:hypothetical protein FHX37_1344 [Haloactinospora alba]|uniref:YbhB/YbcL family Raf kinase inhibitor-like protein n=1 Tax=Haloactinospora alba TaxID=405555 RepID=A0A543NI62_9ACTN|nr:hypothetical protein FHX37_1344 [Haloactinospora alba]